MKEVMIDIEYFGKGPNTVVFQIAYIVFDGETGEWLDLLTLNLHIDDQLKKGRTVEASTLAFWLDPKISQIAKTALETDNKVSVTHAGSYLQAALQQYTVYHSRGADDITILTNLFGWDDTTSPWLYTQTRDLRTTMKECGLVPLPNEQAHSALSDCEFQIKDLMRCREVIRRGCENALAAYVDLEA